jgi:AraC family transcriptional regulator
MVSFTHFGLYTAHVGSRSDEIDPFRVLLINAEEPYSTSGGPAAAARGSSLSVRADVLAEVASRAIASAEGEHRLRFRRLSISTQSRACLLDHLLARSLERDPAPDRLALEEQLLHLLEVAIGEVELPQPSSNGGRKVRKAKALIAAQYSERLLLSDIATELAVSPYHLCHLFRRETGTTVHSYLKAVRLRASLDRILEGQRLVEVAFDVGFASHSHLSAAFKEAFGMTPSQLRAARDRQAIDGARLGPPVET